MFAAAAMLALAPRPFAAESAGKGAAAALPDKLAQPSWPPDQKKQLSKEEQKIDDAALPAFKSALDDLNKNSAAAFNGPPFVAVEKVARGVLRVRPSAGWMAGGRNQQRSAMMVYRFWRTANRLMPVRVMITDDQGADYMLIQDTPHGLDYLVRDRSATP
ncbi:MAG: hypothetical protein WCF16_11415 [Alphaproteobacteria bacterium]